MRHFRSLVSIGMIFASFCSFAISVQSDQKHYTKGTAQLAGDNGKLGVTYTIGKGHDAINLTLLSAEYSTSRVLLGNLSIWPSNTEKLLVLHYTLQNPNPVGFVAGWFTLKFTAVDSNDVNHTNSTHVFKKEGTNEPVQMELKPGQKVAFVTAFAVPSDVSIPKLIVQRGDSQPVLRYNFKSGDIKPLPNGIGEADGFTALKEIEVGSGASGQLNLFLDAQLVNSSYETALGDKKPKKGNRLFVASINIKNRGTHSWTLNGFAFQANIKTDDGEQTGWHGILIWKTARNEGADSSLDAGAEYTVRAIAEVPENANVTELLIRGNDQCRPLVLKIAH